MVLRKEVPGFVANRLQAALFREAVHLVEQGRGGPRRARRGGDQLDRYAVGACGPFAPVHLAGGPGGLPHFLEHLGPAWSCADPARRAALRRADRGHLTSRPRGVRGTSYQDLQRQRDHDQLAIQRALERPSSGPAPSALYVSDLDGTLLLPTAPGRAHSRRGERADQRGRAVQLPTARGYESAKRVTAGRPRGAAARRARPGAAHQRGDTAPSRSGEARPHGDCLLTDLRDRGALPQLPDPGSTQGVEPRHAVPHGQHPAVRSVSSPSPTGPGRACRSPAPSGSAGRWTGAGRARAVAVHHRLHGAPRGRRSGRPGARYRSGGLGDLTGTTRSRPAADCAAQRVGDLQGPPGAGGGPP